MDVLERRLSHTACSILQRCFIINMALLGAVVCDLSVLSKCFYNLCVPAMFNALLGRRDPGQQLLNS